MFKIGETPSVTAHPIEHADYLEFECLRQSDGNASGADLIAALKRIDDDLPEKRATSDERYEAIVDAAFTELKHRSEHCGNSHYTYPFKVSDDHQLLDFKKRPKRYSFYLYMLLATRLDMQTHRVQAGINGTELFERVCCEVAKSYWGEDADGLVFGTARRTPASEVGNFQAAVDDLCTQMSEGVRFHAHSNHMPAAQDGNLDVVVWKSFSDNRHGKIIGFGQCKTGTHWARNVFDLVPEKFCQKWVLTQPVVPPVRLYFIASRVRNTEWFDSCVDAGVLFDRCRILDYAPKMPALEAEWEAWVLSAMKANKLAIP